VCLIDKQATEFVVISSRQKLQPYILMSMVSK